MKDYTAIAAGVGAVAVGVAAAFFDAGIIATTACTIVGGAASGLAAEPVKKLIESCTRPNKKKDDDATRPAPTSTTMKDRATTPTSPTIGTAASSSPVKFYPRMDWGRFAEEKRKQREENSPKAASPHSL